MFHPQLFLISSPRIQSYLSTKITGRCLYTKIWKQNTLQVSRQGPSGCLSWLEWTPVISGGSDCRAQVGGRFHRWCDTDHRDCTGGRRQRIPRECESDESLAARCGAIGPEPHFQGQETSQSRKWRCQDTQMGWMAEIKQKIIWQMYWNRIMGQGLLKRIWKEPRCSK